MRRLTLALLLSIASIAQAQVWEKFVAPGLTYRMEVDVLTPRVIHALRWTPASKYTQAKPQLANRSIYGHDTSVGRATVSHMVAREGAIAGINADFFPWTGDPLGFMMSGGELVSMPFPNRSFFAWGSEEAQFGRVAVTMTLSANGREFAVDGLNEEAGEGMVCANTRTAGFAHCKVPGRAIVLKMESGPIQARSLVEGVVREVVSGSNVRVEESEVVLMAHPTRFNDFEGFQPGDKVTITVDTTGMDLSKMPEAVGGGPMLLKDGQWANQWDLEGFKPDFALKRHPRTAVGRTGDGDIWFVTIDGRQAMSAGATLSETARILARYGCVDALNLDGGGSTTLNVFGQSMNRPSDGKERAVANGIVFLGPRVGPMDSKLQLYGPDKVPRNATRGFRVRLSPSFAVPNSEVFWSASGAAWIDQGGYLRPLSNGRCVIRAFAWGRTLTKTVEITGGR